MREFMKILLLREVSRGRKASNDIKIAVNIVNDIAWIKISKVQILLFQMTNNFKQTLSQLQNLMIGQPLAHPFQFLLLSDTVQQHKGILLT
jgi:hypothetical protein